MSWSDIFFPNNPERRNTTLRLYTKIQTLMEGNFKGTNDLIDIVHKYLPGKTFTKIVVDHDKSIKDNCDVFISKITEVGKYIEEKDDALAMAEPKLYEKLRDTKVKFADKLEHARKASSVALATIGSVAGVFMVSHIRNGKLLASSVQKFGQFRTCAAATVALGVVLLGIDMIISAIVGAVQRDKLEESIKTLETALDKFEPASYEFSKQIQKLEILIEIYFE